MARGKRIKKVGTLSVFLFSLFLLSGFLFTGFVNALTSVSVDTEIRMDVEPIITVSFSTRAAILKASMKPGQLDEMKVGAEIRTNSRTGYKAYLSTDKRRNGATDVRATGLVHINNDTDYIPTLESSVSASDFPVNHWGYSLDGGENYLGMGAINDVDLAEFTSTDSMEKRDLDLYFATKIDSQQANGYYENTIIVTAVANYVAQTINDIQYMQDINNEIAFSMQEDVQYQLKDKRDEKVYWVSRLRDGNIWMTQNLDYTDFADSGKTQFVLTKELSDVWADYIYPSAHYKTLSTTATSTGYETGYFTHYNNVFFNPSNGDYYTLTASGIAEGGDELSHYALGTKYPTEFFSMMPYGKSYTTYGHIFEPDVITTEFDEHIPNSIQSVCPRGWRLPTVSEFETLPYKYGVELYENATPFRNSAAYMLMPNGGDYCKTYNADNSTASSFEVRQLHYVGSSSFQVQLGWPGNCDYAAFVRCVMRW